MYRVCIPSKIPWYLYLYLNVIPCLSLSPFNVDFSKNLFGLFLFFWGFIFCDCDCDTVITAATATTTLTTTIFHRWKNQGVHHRRL